MVLFTVVTKSRGENFFEFLFAPKRAKQNNLKKENVLNCLTYSCELTCKIKSNLIGQMGT